MNIDIKTMYYKDFLKTELEDLNYTNKVFFASPFIMLKIEDHIFRDLNVNKYYRFNYTDGSFMIENCDYIPLTTSEIGINYCENDWDKEKKFIVITGNDEYDNQVNIKDVKDTIEFYKYGIENYKPYQAYLDMSDYAMFKTIEIDYIKCKTINGIVNGALYYHKGE